MATSGNVRTVGNLFTDNVIFVVPDFQRSYSWEDSNIDAFQDDIERAYISSRPHFLGALILREATAGHGVKKVEVIDGQQRLSTIFMYVSILRDLITELSPEEQSIMPNGGQGIPNNIYQEASKLIFVNLSSAKPRFQSNYLLRKTFDECILKDPIVDPNRPKLKQKDKYTTLKLRKAYFRLKNRIDKFILDQMNSTGQKRNYVLMNLLEIFQDRLELLTIYTQTLEEAFDVFMTMNNRGLNLGPGDLVKSLFMKHVSAGKEGEELIAANDSVTIPWSQINDNIESGDLNQFLRHFLLATQENPVQSKGVFAKFEELIEDVKIGQAPGHYEIACKKILSQLNEKSDIYKQLLKPSLVTDEAIREHATAMHALLDSYRIVMMNLLDDKGELEKTDQRLISAMTEALAIRWILAGENAQILENLFQKYAEILRSAIPSTEKALKFRQLVSEALPSDTKCQARFSEEIDSANLVRVVLHRINEVMTGSHGVLNLEATKLNVEHIAPKEGGETNEDSISWHNVLYPDATDEDRNLLYSSVVEQWGNKTILEFKINAALKASSWEKKRFGYIGQSGENIKGYSSSVAQVTQELASIDEWTRDKISERGKWMGEVFCQIWAIEPATYVQSFSEWMAGRR